MKTVQLIQITLEELSEIVVVAVKSEVEKLMTNQSKCDSDKLLTRKEVSEFFKVDISTVHNWTKKGKLKAYGIANRVYYKESELKRALTEI
ncbi:helix-turn-helix domain-containing protein [Flagellimonas oceanensis]|uniref:helix-turn-helix domain-containing protein n=2 Tax=Flagellimonas oceanensis TaxID=2499163 RepID=UPI000F8E6A13|nr:helix-turn-helix domain-containing protein [Allomuricauda oceanensis]